MSEQATAVSTPLEEAFAKMATGAALLGCCLVNGLVGIAADAAKVELSDTEEQTEASEACAKAMVADGAVDVWNAVEETGEGFDGNACLTKKAAKLAAMAVGYPLEISEVAEEACGGECGK